MQRHRFLLAAAVIAAATFPARTQARTFTDDQGRTTEAELSGIAGQEVILRRGGVAVRWPIARLSSADQAFVKEWQSHPPATPHLQVRIWEKQGFSAAGTFTAESNPQPSLPNIPGVLEIEKRQTYHYYDVQISNPAATQANRLSLAYQLYVITASGSLVVDTGGAVLPAIDARAVTKAVTKAISSTQTKTTALALKSVSSRGISASKERTRSGERFGGGWVRVYAQDGTFVGEARQLTPEIEQTKPEWIGPTVAEGSKLESFDQLDSLIEQAKKQLEKIRLFLKSLPPLPDPDGGKPPFPPGLPRPPGG